MQQHGFMQKIVQKQEQHNACAIEEWVSNTSPALPTKDTFVFLAHKFG